MSKLILLILFALLANVMQVQSQGELATVSFQVPTSIPGGTTFGISANVSFSASSTVPTCTLKSQVPLSFSPSSVLHAADGCVLPTTTTFTQIVCNMTAFDVLSTGTQFFNVFDGGLVVNQACVGEVHIINFQCAGIGLHSLNRTFTISSSASQVQATLLDDAPLGDAGNLTDVAVIDYSLNRTAYSVNSTVVNTGSCPAVNVTCVIKLPPVINPFNPSEGLISLENTQYISNFTNCALLVDTLTCVYGTMAPGATQELPLVLDVINNGVMNTSIVCNSEGLVNPALAEDLVTAVGVNFPEGSSSSIVLGSDSSSVIVNVVIPLSVFGGVMIVLLCAIAIVIAITLIIKRMRQDQSVGF